MNEGAVGNRIVERHAQIHLIFSSAIVRLTNARCSRLGSSIGSPDWLADKRATGVGDVPWGSHLCQFYRSKADLVETLVPYFVAGLQQNERCIWIASEPLGAADCFRELEARVPDLAERARRGQIEIMDYADWYTRGEAMDGASTLRRWLDAEAEARQSGYAGLRLTGNTFALDQKDWAAFTDYEASVQATFHNRRIIALCSYCRDRCSADEIIDVIRNHDCALVRREGD